MKLFSLNNIIIFTIQRLIYANYLLKAVSKIQLKNFQVYKRIYI